MRISQINGVLLRPVLLRSPSHKLSCWGPVERGLCIPLCPLRTKCPACAAQVLMKSQDVLYSRV